MTSTALVLFDDWVAQQWAPFALTRPAGELLFGTRTLRERAERALGLRCTAQISADHLTGFEEPGAPPVLPFAEAPADGARLFLCARAVLQSGASLPPAAGPARPVLVGGDLAGWLLPPGAQPPEPAGLRDLAARGSSAQPLALEGRLLRDVWQLVLENADRVAADIEELYTAGDPPQLAAGTFRQGAHPLVLGEGAVVEPGVLIDTTAGPVWLDRGVTVRSPARLAGPAYVGPGSTILGGTIEQVAIGPVCKVRGEVAESVFAGYVNKAHDGHIGHAYLGRWVNLGAGTTNSDLKNNYGTVRVWTPEGERDTGSIKMGCLLGDHVKTGIGLMLNTGTVIGAGCNLYGSAMPPKYVPPFSWGTGEQLVEFRLDKFLEVAERAMARRDLELGDGARRQLREAWRRGRDSLARPAPPLRSV